MSGQTGSGNIGEVPTEGNMVPIKTCPQPKIGDHYYRMESNPRGYCLIFNIFEFPNHSDYQLRKGSQNEARHLSQVFKELYFIPEVFDNPTKKDVLSTVEEYATKDELIGHDAIVIIVLSHGENDGFVTHDIGSGGCDGLIRFKDVVDKLNNKNCSHLINKPKLFFFSCCRGNTHDFGVEHSIPALDNLAINSVTDSITFNKPESNSTNVVTVKVPMASDIMICYSTVDGYVSWRCEESGTWLGLALIQTLVKESHERDLLHMLTTISNTIDKKKFMSGNREAKQVIEVILRGFKKKFYFNSGYPPLVAGDIPPSPALS